MQLQYATKSSTEVETGYACPCGCKPRLAFTRDGENQKDVCCCGTQLVVGIDARSGLELRDGLSVGVEEFDSPWGEALEAAWAIEPDPEHTH